MIINFKSFYTSCVFLFTHIQFSKRKNSKFFLTFRIRNFIYNVLISFSAKYQFQMNLLIADFITNNVGTLRVERVHSFSLWPKFYCT